MIQPTKTHLAIENDIVTAQSSPHLFCTVLYHCAQFSGVKSGTQDDGTQRDTYVIGGNHGDGGEDIKTIDREILEHEDIFPDVPAGVGHLCGATETRGKGYSLETSEEVGPMEFGDVDEVELAMISASTITPPSAENRPLATTHG